MGCGWWTGRRRCGRRQGGCRRWKDPRELAEVGLAQAAEGRGAFAAPREALSTLVGLAFDPASAVRRPALKLLSAAGAPARTELAGPLVGSVWREVAIPER